MEPTGKFWRGYRFLLPNSGSVTPSTLQSQCHMIAPTDLLSFHLHVALLHCCTIDARLMDSRGAASEQTSPGYA